MLCFGQFTLLMNFNSYNKYVNRIFLLGPEIGRFKIFFKTFKKKNLSAKYQLQKKHYLKNFIQ